ncbi:MAG TPA: SRPBCC domain-containing protein [Gaiellaceae bacterium]|nr:SRPBCC domain-containing protein [Gaiellaceae bacterium]
MVPERIEREVLIEAPLEVVWSVVTESDHVAGWFGDSAEIDLRPGGAAVFTWEKHGSAIARVEKVEPPHTFSFRWARPLGAEPDEGNSTLVEFSLSAEGEHTRLRVVESGFQALDASEEEKATYAEGNTEGWTAELDELQEYVAKLARASAPR